MTIRKIIMSSFGITIFRNFNEIGRIVSVLRLSDSKYRKMNKIV